MCTGVRLRMTRSESSETSGRVGAEATFGKKSRKKKVATTFPYSYRGRIRLFVTAVPPAVTCTVFASTRAPAATLLGDVRACVRKRDRATG